MEKKKKGRKENKQKAKKKEGEEKQPTASHPSMNSQRPQEHWIGATGNHRRHPLPRTVLSASVRINSYWHSGCRQGCQELILYAGPNQPLNYWGGNIQIPVCK